jgi:heme-degrading monooxygenase HmoA
VTTPVRSVIRFEVKPGREADFEAAFAASGMLTRPSAVDGFMEAELLRAVDRPSEYVVIGSWASVSAYRDWQAISAAGAPREALARLVDTLIDPRPGLVFAVAASS